MASRKTYPCFACQKTGHDDVWVFLDGKDEQGRTKYLNEDGTIHTHLGSSQLQTQQQPTTKPTHQQLQQQGQGSMTAISVSEATQLKIVNAKLDRILSLLEERMSRFEC